MGNSDIEPQTEYVDAIRRKMPAWKRASIGSVALAVIVVLALTANIWLPALVTVIEFCAIGIVIIAFVGVVLVNMFVRQGPTLQDHQQIQEALKDYGLYQQPVVEGSTVGQQNMVDAIEKLATHAMQMDEKIEQHNATVDAKLDMLFTMVTQLLNVAHSNDAEEAPANILASSAPPKKAEENKAILLRWVRANRDDAMTMDLRKIAKATGVNRKTSDKFIKDYREGKITI
jgi:hypothetical protein